MSNGTGAELEKQLKVLEQRNWGIQNSLKKKEDALKASRNNEKILADLVANFSKMFAEYDDAHQELGETLRDFEAYYDQLKKCVKHIDPRIIKAVRKMRRVAAGEIAKLKGRVAYFERELWSDTKKAEVKAEKAKIAFDRAMARKKHLEDTFKALDDIRKKVTEAEQKSEFARVYYYAREFRGLLRSARRRYVSPDDHASKLSAKWLDLQKANHTAAVVKADAEKKAADFKLAQTKLDDAKKNRESKLLAKVAELDRK